MEGIHKNTLDAAKVELEFSIRKIQDNVKELNFITNEMPSQIEILSGAIGTPGIRERLNQLQNTVEEINNESAALLSLANMGTNPAHNVNYFVRKVLKTKTIIKGYREN